MRPEGGSVIGLRTALILYAVLVVVAFVAVKGSARAFALLIVGALVAKAIIHYSRGRLE